MGGCVGSLVSGVWNWMSAGHRGVRRGTPGEAGCNLGPFVKKLSSAETSRGRLARGLAA